MIVTRGTGCSTLEQASNETHELNQQGLSVYDHVTETYALVEIQG